MHAPRRLLALAVLAFAPTLAHATPPAPATPAPTAELEVRLTIDKVSADGRSFDYRITHTYRGGEARRFVTGATDRNCEDPIDVLVSDDGTAVHLYSLLPCGGFAFRSAKRIGPGESWEIAGSATLPARAKSVRARYCATQDNLKEVAPNERSAREPIWWLGCADSAPIPVGQR